MLMSDTAAAQPSAMRRYYRWHATIYDATRWTFLLGRNEMLRRLPIKPSQTQTLLEVGCGTGRNLRWLAQRHPLIRLIGADVSPDMLGKAQQATAPYAERVTLLEHPYGAEVPLELPQTPDFVLFSYALTMFNPGWEAAIEQAWADLPVGGRLAVVDFHDTPSEAFRWWMSKNHVRMDGHLLPFLREKFDTEFQAVRPAWLLGAWRYFVWLGEKRAPNFTQI
jgi:S-adenosylmethionine-diacylgycerolhomoserine-N-methlytransferase